MCIEDIQTARLLHGSKPRKKSVLSRIGLAINHYCSTAHIQENTNTRTEVQAVRNETEITTEELDKISTQRRAISCKFPSREIYQSILLSREA